MSNKMIEIEVELIHSTDLAILISDGDQEVWLPKSQVEWDYVGDSLILIELQVPEWLAIDKGLI